MHSFHYITGRSKWKNTSSYRTIRNPPEYSKWCAKRQTSWRKLSLNPDAYYYSYLPPGVTAPTTIDFSDEEQKLFLNALKVCMYVYACMYSVSSM